VLQAGPTPPVNTATWKFTITTETGDTTRWDWKQFTALPAEDITTDIHCVTQWSKLGTHWRGVSLDTLLMSIDTNAAYVMARSYGGYTTNLPLADLPPASRTSCPEPRNGPQQRQWMANYAIAASAIHCL
jgi:DMSO/TMAO reductase YedYZ molybdopterin-dependent catalytic subunit